MFYAVRVAVFWQAVVKTFDTEKMYCPHHLKMYLLILTRTVCNIENYIFHKANSRFTKRVYFIFLI